MENLTSHLGECAVEDGVTLNADEDMRT